MEVRGGGYSMVVIKEKTELGRKLSETSGTIGKECSRLYRRNSDSEKWDARRGLEGNGKIGK